MRASRIIVAIVATGVVGGLVGWGTHGLSERLEQRRLISAHYEPAPEGMVFVPAGWFIMGSDDPQADHLESPARRVFLPAFYIDRHEVTNAEYKRFDPTWTFPEGRENFPVTGIGIDDARAYAESVGKRLPTSAEWEKAARGVDGRAYPWGDTFEAGRANIAGGADLMAVGTHRDGASPYGVEDMTGNAWEWVDDVYEDSSALGIDSATVRGIIRGGGFNYSAYQGRTSHIAFEDPALACNDLGFRCVRDARANR